MPPRDCRITCRGPVPLDRRTQTQIGAFAGSLAILGLVLTPGKKPVVRAGAAAAGAAAGAFAATALGQLLAEKRCQAVCEALNKLEAGEEVIAGWWLRSAMRWFVDDLLGQCDDDDFACWAAAKLAPFLASDAVEAGQEHGMPGSVCDSWAKR